MNIYGIGSDLVNVKRIDLILKRNKNFKNKVFSNKEINLSSKSKNKTHYFAKRFGAKEAFLKALGTGISDKLNFNEIEILNNKKGKPILKVNNIYGIYRAILSGVGIGALPNYIIEDSTTLVRVLPEMQCPDTDVYFVYPEELRQSARIAVFRDFLVRKIIDYR